VRGESHSPAQRVARVQRNTHAAVAGIDNMTIDFHGASLIFTRPLYYGLVVYASTNATVQNLTADFQPLPFTQLRVVTGDVPNSQIQYTVEAGYQHPSAFNSLTGWRGEGPHSIEVLVFRNNQPAFGTRRMLTARPFSGDRLPLMSVTAPATVDAIRPGDIAVVRLRAFGSDPVNANHCTGCTLRNITVYSTASGGAAVGMISSRSSVLERVYLMPKPGTDRAADAVRPGRIALDEQEQRVTRVQHHRVCGPSRFRSPAHAVAAVRRRCFCRVPASRLSA
jgi:hypothetical protein